MNPITQYFLEILMLLLSFTGCDAPPEAATRCWVNIHNPETRQVIETIYVDVREP
jgi:hypothetical protein